ncbi:hypothetical protein BDY21DRAFT_151528 [Lineolata rhizophorae]|uniref:Zn(2)-C6 fungal-type domain-containing protein n=1 Tax=Lineolata rhizophorae TaxID=578093 RepID=A0A6A6NM23_9PEZI|nr:hypothetical protein BDY21DRAFT_151528 [Lineolata rhizophorae]
MTSPSLAQASPPQLPAQPASNPEPTSPTASTPNEAEAKIHDTHASYQFTHYPPYGQYVPATQAGFPQHDYAVDPQLSRPSIGSNGEPGNVQGYTGAQAAMTGFASPPATGAPSPPGTDKKKATQACDRCKNKKTRCTHAPGSPSCKACTKAGVQCEYTHEAQKRGPEKGAHKNLVAQVDELRAEMEQMKHDHSMELASLRQGLDELQKAFMEWVGAAPPAPTPKACPTRLVRPSRSSWQARSAVPRTT